MRGISRMLPFCLAIAAFAGCSKRETVVLVPAEGFLTINGKPAANIMVQVLPDALQGAKGPTSTGVTDEVGWFKLTTVDGREGAVLGPCKIVLADLLEERAPQGERTILPRIPASYTVVSPQSLSSEIKEDEEPIKIDLKV